MNEWINGWMNNLKYWKNIYYLSTESKVIIVSKRVRSCIDIPTHLGRGLRFRCDDRKDEIHWSYLLYGLFIMDLSLRSIYWYTNVLIYRCIDIPTHLGRGLRFRCDDRKDEIHWSYLLYGLFIMDLSLRSI